MKFSALRLKVPVVVAMIRLVRASMAIHVTAYVLMVSVLIGACRDGTTSEASAAYIPVAAESELANSNWLMVNDETPPERWLINRRLDLSGESDERVIAQLLAEASLRFQENPRMIANRAFQLQSMLNDAGIPEDAIRLIEVFLLLPDLPRLRSFSANCQHYFNLRRQGNDPSAALTILGAL
ncbi:MAG: hypothetical protein ACK5ME_04775 [Parahaliea sp.]